MQQKETMASECSKLESQTISAPNGYTLDHTNAAIWYLRRTNAVNQYIRRTDAVNWSLRYTNALRRIPWHTDAAIFFISDIMQLLLYQTYRCNKLVS